MQILFKPLIDRVYACFIRTFEPNSYQLNPKSQLEHKTRTSQPVYNRIYRM